ncbi:MAG TPA: response regulator [Spirochaetota bacterium]|nr:response regulator [Spirochaetota bacterium]
MESYNIFNDLNTSEKTVLIVDDNPTNLKILGKMLENIGFNVRGARSGEECLNSVAASKPDIVLLDIHMPGMDGYEVCKKLKSDSESSDIPVIFISALSEEFNKVQGFEFGGVDYITKPFELKDVELRVKTHLLLKDRTCKLKAALSELRQKEQQLIQSEKMAALGVLTSGVAHEINNPVNFIYNSFNALKSKIDALENSINKEGSLSQDKNFLSLTEDIPQIYKNISNGLDYIVNIVKSLKIYSRMDKDELVVSNIDELLDSALLILYHRYKNNIKIEKKCLDLPKIKCHPGKLSQVFINILSNSIDAIEEDSAINSDEKKTGFISIDAKTENDAKDVVIEFSDNGLGIDEEHKNKIFDPFWTSKEVGKGTGLGLSISLSIIKELNGDIRIESVKGKGTVVKVIIPA